jgi:carbamoyltransferase
MPPDFDPEMIILGIGGFETSWDWSRRRWWSPLRGSLDDMLRFTDHCVPLQFCPLHLIGHDSSAALLVDGRLVSFISEERLTRVKHGLNMAGQTTLPRCAMERCLREGGIRWDQVDYFAHYCRFTEEAMQRRYAAVAAGLDPAHRDLLQQEYADAYASRLQRSVILRQISEIAGREIPDEKLIQVPHHLAHAAGAFYSSDFPESLIFTIDGYGETNSCLWGIGRENSIEPLGDVPLPTSLGLLYQVITAYLGFRSLGDEYKVMGLSAYGNPKTWKRAFDGFLELQDDCTYRLRGLTRPDLLESLKEVFEDRAPHRGFSPKAADIAAALQSKLEETVRHHLAVLKRQLGAENLCLSGGVALNACLNSAVIRSKLFRRVFIQPAASDDGASLGAALYLHHQVLGCPRRQPIRHVFWGPAYSPRDVEAALRSASGVRWSKPADVEECTARLLAEGKLVGWFHGRMEMGPRALGARSILADPRSAALRERLNGAVKNRESFRPFAPAVISDRARRFFDLPPGIQSPYMLITFPTRDLRRDQIPGVVHVDGSARIQTVSPEDNPRFHRLLQKFHALTRVPVLLNTSFNRAGEPIVCSPEDALRCFLASGLDALVIEDWVVVPAN